MKTPVGVHPGERKEIPGDRPEPPTDGVLIHLHCPVVDGTKVALKDGYPHAN